MNFIGTIAEYFDITARVNHIFDVLDPYIISGDAKDVALDDPAVVHLKEAPVGAGTFDFDTFLTRFARICPDGFLHLEHFPLDDALRGQAVLRERAAHLGIAITGGAPVAAFPAGSPPSG